MAERQPVTHQNISLDINNSLNTNKIKDYASGLGGKIFQVPRRNSIPQKSRDVRISRRDAIIVFALQQLRHVKYCREKKCSYKWCDIIKSLLDHWKVCKERKNNVKCYKCDSLRVLFFRSQGKYVDAPRRNNNNNNSGGNNISTNMPIQQTTATLTT